MGITTNMLSKSPGSLIKTGEPVSLKYNSIISPSIWEATSIKYLELKLISKSLSNYTDNVSLPSPLFELFTDKFKVSFVKLNFTPSFLSRDTDATLSTEFKNDFKLISIRTLETNISSSKDLLRAIDENLVPTSVRITSMRGSDVISINLEYSQYDFPDNLTFPMDIPEG